MGCGGAAGGRGSIVGEVGVVVWHVDKGDRVGRGEGEEVDNEDKTHQQRGPKDNEEEGWAKC